MDMSSSSRNEPLAVSRTTAVNASARSRLTDICRNAWRTAARAARSTGGLANGSDREAFHKTGSDRDAFHRFFMGFSRVLFEGILPTLGIQLHLLRRYEGGVFF